VKKVLLDECVARKFKNHLSGLHCRTVSDAGWAGKKNGELLALAEQADFEAFITLDRGVQYQQNLAGRAITVVLVHARSSRLTDLIPHAAAIVAALESAQPGQLLHVPPNEETAARR